MDSQRQTALHTTINANNNTTQQQKKTEDNLPLNRLEQVANAVAQTGRTIGGIAQGVAKTIAAPGIAAEAKGLYRPGQNQKAVAEYNKQSAQSGTTHKPMTEAANKINTGIQNMTDSWVPPPQTGAAEFVAKASDALGEAVPAIATAVATGGVSASSVLAGNAISWAAGAGNAFSTEMLEGSGDLARSVISGVAEFGAEAVGGKVLNEASKHIANPVASWAADSVGEGLEEIISGVSQAALTGEKYTASQAVEEFALGATVGAVASAGISGVNAASEGITKSRVQHDVNARISNAAKSDVNDVKSLLAHGNDSGASAVIAQDSLTAIQKQVANPFKTGPQQTSAIPSDIAQKYGLRTVEGGEAPLQVTVKNSYEGLVEPTVSQLAAPEVSLAERALIDPNNVDAETLANPRAVYQYAQEDIYLKPGADVGGNRFTYRGQANQFYRSGLFPASGIGTSFEGSGVYSGLTPYTTDLYGPTGKLADNPYSSRGIKQKAVDVDYPIGVIVQQAPRQQEVVSPLIHKDAPHDIVPQGERRVRYDDKGQGRVTEVINNPKDVKAVGLIFGRTSIADATPIQYANSSQSTSLNETESVTNANVGESLNTNAATLDQSKTLRSNEALTEESAAGEYVIPQFINTNEIATAANAGDESETASRTTAEQAAQSVSPAQRANEVTTSSPPNSGDDVTEGRVPDNELKSSSESRLPIETISTRTSEKSRISSEPENTSIATEPAIPSKSETGTPEAVIPESTTAKDTPESPSDIESPSTTGTPESPETSTPVETPEERAIRIWTPIQAMERASSNISYRDREEKLPTYDFNLSKGQGSQGQIYETAGYKQTFGGLSSY